MKRSVLLLIIFCWSCGSDFVETKEASTAVDKSDYSQKGKADSNVDYCAVFGWYGDGECDTFCQNEDVQDCRENTQCEDLCADRADNSCFDDERCVAACEENSDAAVEDIRACLGQPICYQTLGSCVANRTDIAFCEDACSEQRDNPNGWCGFDVCVQFCRENHNTWDSTTEATFYTCATEDPVCYSTWDNCMGVE